VPHVAVVVCLH